MTRDAERPHHQTAACRGRTALGAQPRREPRGERFLADPGGFFRGGLAGALGGAFDLIVLDVMLPEGDEAGFRFARALREADFTQPILFLTARETLPDRVRGLEYGDDYLPKPFALPELVARLRALYRRKEVRPQSVHFGALELLLLNPGRIFTRDEIPGRIWGAGFDTPPNLVDVYVKNLRLKAGAATVETVRGLGYRFPGA